MNLVSEYEGSICVITGATSGNGEALALELQRLGAVVYGLGRNPEKLDSLSRRHIHAIHCDLSDKDSIYDALEILPDRIDFVFHMAGNALVGLDIADDRAIDFMESDYYGPILLLDNLIYRISPCGGVAVVTSASAALEDIPEILIYQEIKRKMVEWWVAKNEWCLERSICLTLISMGGINTGIWKGTPDILHRLSRLLPGPKAFTRQILKDVALKRSVSYPGVGASLAPIIKGKYCPNPLVKKAFSVFARICL